jgi:chemosensory pili system protein ChpA (sensor histidine kinase/response regulator)
MLVKCPSCSAKLRVSTGQFNLKEQRIRYLCNVCEKIVLIDLLSDAIPSSSSSDLTQPVRHTPKILIADDMIAFQKIAEDLLTKEGFSVITARDGLEALKKVMDERPDLILLDLSMPNMSGFEVLKMLKKNTGYKSFRNIPVLVTSGVYKAAEVEIIHDLGAEGFISKEAVPELLVYRIKKVLANLSGAGEVPVGAGEP